VPGVTLRVIGRQPFGGPISVGTDGGEQVLAHELAALLLCAAAGSR